MCAACTAAGCIPKEFGRYRCTGNDCQKELGCRQFVTKQLKNFKERGGVLLCKACSSHEVSGASADQAKESGLRSKADKSRRKKCTCGRRLGHAEKCPMHKRNAYEKPYPWCDVMTRQESEWLEARLQARRQKRKA